MEKTLYLVYHLQHMGIGKETMDVILTIIDNFVKTFFESEDAARVQMLEELVKAANKFATLGVCTKRNINFFINELKNSLNGGGKLSNEQTIQLFIKCADVSRWFYNHYFNMKFSPKFTHLKGWGDVLSDKDVAEELKASRK